MNAKNHKPKPCKVCGKMCRKVGGSWRHFRPQPDGSPNDHNPQVEETDRQSVTPDPVGAVEIATRLGVQRATVDQWRQRGLFLEPRWTVGGRPAWDWADIEAWAELTGRSSLPPKRSGAD